MKRKIKLYYFSGTGNSLKIVKDLEMGLQDTEVYAMTALMQSSEEVFIEGDTVGFIFPIYFARVPVIVERFIDQCTFGNIQYLFAVANGGGWFGRTMKVFERQLEDKGKKLDAGFVLGMPGNHPKIAKFNKTSHNDYFAGERKKVAAICDHVKYKRSQPAETNLGLFGMMLTYGLFKPPYKQSKEGTLDEVFMLKDVCDGCGLCERLCPVGNIRMIDKKPGWHHQCVNCLSCYHLCPKEAIEFQDDTMPRYQNPYVKVNELINSRQGRADIQPNQD